MDVDRGVEHKRARDGADTSSSEEQDQQQQVRVAAACSITGLGGLGGVHDCMYWHSAHLLCVSSWVSAATSGGG